MEMLQSDVVVGRLIRALTQTVDAVDHNLGQISELGSDPARILEQHKQRAWGYSRRIRPRLRSGSTPFGQSRSTPEGSTSSSNPLTQVQTRQQNPLRQRRSWHSSCAAKPLLQEPERSGITTTATIALFTVFCIASMNLIVTIFALCTGACVARMGTLGTQDSRFK